MIKCMQSLQKCLLAVCGISAMVLTVGSQASLPTDIELISSAARIKERIQAIETYATPIRRNIRFILTAFRALEQGAVQGLTREQYAQYEKNLNVLEQILQDAEPITKKPTKSLQQKLQNLTQRQTELSQRYLDFTARYLPFNNYSSMALFMMSVLNAFVFKPCYTAISLSSAAGILYVSSHINSQNQDNLRTAMHSLSVAMEDIEKDALDYHRQLLQLQRRIETGYALILQNLAFQQQIPVKNETEISSSISNYHRSIHTINIITENSNPIGSLKSLLPEFLEKFSEGNVLAINFAHKDQPESQNHGYRIVRWDNMFYMNLSTTNEAFILFPQNMQLVDYLQTIAELSESDLFGYMMFHPGKRF